MAARAPASEPALSGGGLPPSAAPPAAGLLRRTWDVLLLALLPLAQLAWDPTWTFDGPSRDQWIYYGYFRFGRLYVQEAGLNTYYASRLSVILPGYLLHHLLPMVVANTLLHLFFYGAAVGAFYLAARAYVGRRGALLAAIALGGHRDFLGAIGSNYVDGFGIAYYLLALAALAVAVRRPAAGAQGGLQLRPPLLLAAAGALAVAVVTANLVYGLYLPVLALHFFVLNRRGARLRPLGAACWLALGAVAALVGMQLVWRLWGAGQGFFLAPTVRWLWGFVQNTSVFKLPFAYWGPQASWLLFPGLVLASSLVILGRRLIVAWRPLSPAAGEPARGAVEAAASTASTASTASRPPGSLTGAEPWDPFVQLQYVAFAALMLAAELGPRGYTLEYKFYASLLLPPAFLALAGQLSPLLAALSARTFAGLAIGLAAALSWLSVHRLPLGFAAAWRQATPGLAVSFLLVIGAIAAMVAITRRRAALAPTAPRAWRRAVLILALFVIAPEIFQLVKRSAAQLRPALADRRAFSRQLAGALTLLRQADPSLHIRLWYDLREPEGPLYDSLACSWRLCTRLMNSRFPDPAKGATCDFQPVTPGMRFAVVSPRPVPAVVATATQALASVGIVARPQGSVAVPGPVTGVRLVFLQVTAVPSPRR